MALMDARVRQVTPAFPAVKVLLVPTVYRESPAQRETLVLTG